MAKCPSGIGTWMAVAYIDTLVKNYTVHRRHHHRPSVVPFIAAKTRVAESLADCWSRIVSFLFGFAVAFLVHLRLLTFRVWSAGVLCVC